jgi:hypothetical protein
MRHRAALLLLMTLCAVGLPAGSCTAELYEVCEADADCVSQVCRQVLVKEDHPHMQCTTACSKSDDACTCVCRESGDAGYCASKDTQVSEKNGPTLCRGDSKDPCDALCYRCYDRTFAIFDDCYVECHEGRDTHPECAAEIDDYLFCAERKFVDGPMNPSIGCTNGPSPLDVCAEEAAKAEACAPDPFWWYGLFPSGK